MRERMSAPWSRSAAPATVPTVRAGCARAIERGEAWAHSEGVARDGASAHVVRDSARVDEAVVVDRDGVGLQQMADRALERLLR